MAGHVRYLIWTQGPHVAYTWARKRRLHRTDFGYVPYDDVDAHLRGVQGPLRNPSSPYRLVIIPVYGWSPTERDLALVRAMGFEPEMVI